MSEEPESPVETPEAPPEEDDVPDPTPPAEEPPPEEQPAPEAQLEPHLGLGEFLVTAPALRGLSLSVQKAAAAGMKAWMRQQGHDANGHYPLAQWQEYYQDMLAHA